MINAIDSRGRSTLISLKRARKYEARGRGRFVSRPDAGGVVAVAEQALFVFAREGFAAQSVQASMDGSPAPLAGQHSPRFVEVAEWSSGITDSGFSLLPYPQRSYATGPRYPVLARLGAGL